jgi:hypothetical protein
LVLRKERGLNTNCGRNNHHIENRASKYALGNFIVKNYLITLAFRTSTLAKPFPV